MDTRPIGRQSLVSIQIFVEGGGERPDLRAECRKGFKDFLEEAGFQGKMPRIIACGPRNDAYDSFKTAHENNETCLLLVDAEEPIIGGHTPWQHLKARDNWSKPRGAAEEQCHMMVQIMESWFLADKDALADFYGQGFQANTIPQNPNVERVSKRDVLDKLKQATRRTQKGAYSKSSHSFKILAMIDPDKVKEASWYAKRFLEQLDHQIRLNEDS